MYSKVAVKGNDKTPLYQYLTGTGGGEIRWNFTKFLVGKDGQVIARFETKVAPDDADFVKAVEQALGR
jgi:glutathione peroxidase